MLSCVNVADLEIVFYDEFIRDVVDGSFKTVVSSGDVERITEEDKVFVDRVHHLFIKDFRNDPAKYVQFLHDLLRQTSNSPETANSIMGNFMQALFIWFYFFLVDVILHAREHNGDLYYYIIEDNLDDFFLRMDFEQILNPGVYDEYERDQEIRQIVKK
jgi:hypothetical protein